MAKLLNIFRAGRHVASSGQAIVFSEADLGATAAAYDPALHEAPLVVGHPKGDAPAYGWVKGLSFSDGGISAEPHQVDAAFQELVSTGRFKKISASFYLPDAPQNPVPGVYYLRHVGFLGAQAPAVKGLKDAQFNEREEGVVEFGDLGDISLADIVRSLREWIIGRFGLEEADQAIPAWDVRAVEEASREPAPEPASDYAEAKLKGREAELKAREDKVRLREAELRADALVAKNQGILAFCEGLTKEGKVPPAQQGGLASFMMCLNEASVVDFGDGAPETMLGWLKGFLSSLPKQVDFTEIGPGQAVQPPTADFAAPQGFTVDPGGLEIHARASAYMKDNPGTTYFDAVKEAIK